MLSDSKSELGCEECTCRLLETNGFCLFGNCSEFRLTCMKDLHCLQHHVGFHARVQKHHTCIQIHVSGTHSAVHRHVFTGRALPHTASKLLLKRPGIGRGEGKAIHFNPHMTVASNLFGRIQVPSSRLVSSSPLLTPVPSSSTLGRLRRVCV